MITTPKTRAIRVDSTAEAKRHQTTNRIRSQTTQALGLKSYRSMVTIADIELFRIFCLNHMRNGIHQERDLLNRLGKQMKAIQKTEHSTDVASQSHEIRDPPGQRQRALCGVLGSCLAHRLPVTATAAAQKPKRR